MCEISKQISSVFSLLLKHEAQCASWHSDVPKSPQLETMATSSFDMHLPPETGQSPTSRTNWMMHNNNETPIALCPRALLFVIIASTMAGIFRCFCVFVIPKRASNKYFTKSNLIYSRQKEKIINIIKLKRKEKLIKNWNN